jgi:hypothetical protein
MDRTMSSPIICPEEIHQLLLKWPKAILLYDSVVDYFGRDLKFFWQDENVKSSGITYKRVEDDFHEIIVTVCPEPSAVAHECLHLKLKMEGFPIGMGSGASFRMSGPIHNQLHHSIFIDDSLSIGFDRTQFVFNPDGLTDISDVQENIEYLKGEPLRERLLRGYLNAQLFSHLIARRTGFPHQIESLMKIGRENISTMDQDARWIEEWYDRAEFRKPEKHAHAINELLNAIGFDSVDFVKVEPIGGRIRVV